MQKQFGTAKSSMQAKRRITLINRHYPPNLNITGENAWDLASYLINKHNIEVTIVHIDRKYEGGGTQREPVGNVYPVKTIYEGKNKWLAYLSGTLDGFNLVRKAAKLNHGPLVVMTSPPLLSMWASMVLRKKREWILWSMDLFPEGFAATGEISASSIFYKLAYRQTYKNAPSKMIALGPQQRRVLEEKYKQKIETILLPCGVFLEQNNSPELPVWKKEPNKIYLGYCGNCGGPHNAEYVKEVIDGINPDTQHLILAVYGIKADQVKAHAKGRPGITILEGGVARKDLHHIDVHLVTLLDTWTHVAVPSKAVSSICSGATIMFCGNKNSDNWVLLQEAGWLVEDNENLRQNVKNALNSLNKHDIQQKRANANQIASRLNALIQESYTTIASWAK
jgi:hypothetical protein